MFKPITYLLLIGLLISCNGTGIITEVSVSGRQILVNETPYFIKGICYHPVPKGSDVRDFGSLSQDLDLMLEAGINTIRVYAPIDDEAVLNEIHTAGIKLIVGFGYNQGGIYDILSGTFMVIKQMVYISHKTRLMHLMQMHLMKMVKTLIIMKERK